LRFGIDDCLPQKRESRRGLPARAGTRSL
jgi:hypothetical protein